MKTYTVKSSAHRGAKRAGLTREQYDVVEVVVDGVTKFKVELKKEPVAKKPAAVKKAPTKKVGAVKKVTPTKKEEPREILRASTVDGPTKLVWHIADAMLKADPAVRRKDVIEECVRRGIAFYTARTQYQYWHQATRNA